MYIYDKVNYSDFRQRFINFGRLEHFPLGLRVLFDYLESIAEDTETPIELDVIAICCEWCELDIKDIERETGFTSLEELQDNHIVLEVNDDTIIYNVY